MICRKCRATMETETAETKKTAEAPRAMAVGGVTEAVASVSQLVRKPKGRVKAVLRLSLQGRADRGSASTADDVIIAECGHFSPPDHRRFCQECSAERWCCGECGQPLAGTDVLPAD